VAASGGGMRCLAWTEVHRSLWHWSPETYLDLEITNDKGRSHSLVQVQ
jgi:hypothetical protein